MVKSTKKDANDAKMEDNAENRERQRLRKLAFSRKLISQTRSNPSRPLQPTKVILNSDGKDIVKKGQRKSKYLFSFPCLVAPVSGGKMGELVHLDTKNPVLYVDFPQGRLKFFGTIIYPKNKYLTLHFMRGSGNVVCEDSFDSLSSQKVEKTPLRTKGSVQRRRSTDLKGKSKKTKDVEEKLSDEDIIVEVPKESRKGVRRTSGRGESASKGKQVKSPINLESSDEEKTSSEPEASDDSDEEWTG